MNTRMTLRTLAAAWAGSALALLASLPSPAAAEGIAPITFEAVVTQGAPRLSEPMNLIVWSRNGAQAQAVVARADSVPAKLSLPSGEYRVVAIHGTARRVQDIEVTGAAGQTHLIDLRAGEIDLSLRPSAKARAVEAPLEWRVHRYRKGAEKGKEVARLQGNRPRLLLREGWYEVEVDFEGRTVGHLIEVNAGQAYNYTLIAD